LTGPILVILPHNPGDVVMALQAIRRVKADHPGLEADYLVSEECRELVHGSPLIRRAFAIPKKALKASWNAGDDAGLIACLESFLADLAATRYVLSANLFQERSGALIQSLVNADRKIGLELLESSFFGVRSRFLEHLFAIPAHRAGNAWHAVDIYARAISRALEDGPERNGASPPTGAASPGASAASTGASRAPRRAGNAIPILPPLYRPDSCASLTPGEYLAFHPGSAWAGKRWPEARWAALAARCAEAGFRIAFTGSPEEKPVMERIASAMNAGTLASVIDCVGATTLAGAAWILANARMVVTGDTVAMHLAAASGTPTVSLFGASNPVETGPYGKGHVIIQTDLNPPPDLAFDKEHPGLAHLRPEEVADYLLEGIPPPGFATWETGWDDARRMQVLTDSRRLPHPNAAGASGLLRVLDRRGEEHSVRPVPRPNGPREKLAAALARCLADPESLRAPGSGTLAALEAAERELAEETQADLVWEAYRIAINGLSLQDLRSHLAERRARFELALREEALASEALASAR
jgi:ADP-heptose:LPS heptosyltransferase